MVKRGSYFAIVPSAEALVRFTRQSKNSNKLGLQKNAPSNPISSLHHRYSLMNRGGSRGFGRGGGGGGTSLPFFKILRYSRLESLQDVVGAEVDFNNEIWVHRTKC